MRARPRHSQRPARRRGPAGRRPRWRPKRGTGRRGGAPRRPATAESSEAWCVPLGKGSAEPSRG
eukprot:6111238-Prymnesium_polylepis.1